MHRVAQVEKVGGVGVVAAAEVVAAVVREVQVVAAVWRECSAVEVVARLLPSFAVDSASSAAR